MARPIGRDAVMAASLDRRSRVARHDEPTGPRIRYDAHHATTEIDMAKRTLRRRRIMMATICSAACVLGLTAAYAPAARAGATAVSGASSALPIYLNTHYSFAERAADLVSRMTLQEKAQQLSTNSAPAIPRLGVQQYTYWSEGQHGVNTLGADQDNGGVSGGVHATSFPTNFASTMSWDPSLVYQETSAISDEVRGFNDPSLFGTGQNNLGPSAEDYGSLTFWAPTVNMDRDPRWGRTDEAFGEDPYLVGQMAGAFVNGYEGNTMSGTSETGYLKVAATAKHFALNNVEDNRTGISSDVNDTDLRDYYTAQFKDLIENAHVSGLMTSYNAINDTPSVADTYTANELAQRTYGFDGYVTSDCGAVGTTYNTFPSGHDWAPPGWTTDGLGANSTWTNTTTGTRVSGPAGGQAYALRAGTDLNCSGDENSYANIEAAIKAGVLSEGVIDNALVKLFTVRMETGEFDPRSKVSYTDITKAQIQSPAHQALARTVADNSLVLLKNADVTGTDRPLLPVDPATLGKVVILGDMANTVTLGDYSGDPTQRISAVQGITDEVKAANPNAQVIFDAAGTSSTATTPAVLSAQTRADIESADLVVLFVGTNLNNATEGKDRTTLAMPGDYDSLIDQVTALGNPRTALVIQSNGPVTIDNEQAKVPAIVFSGYNGEAQGEALADVLTGKQDPDGHLDFTWYRDDAQLPPMSDYGLTPADTEGLGRTYQYFTGTPTYPFGYGLSYSHFSYSPATVDRRSVSADGKVDVNFTVTNTGSVAGSTVAQLYVSTDFQEPGVEQLPLERLEGFRKTRVLRPGQSQHITIPVTISDLSVWDPKVSRQVVYDGTYQFKIGTDATHILSAPRVTVTGRWTPTIKYVTVQPENIEFDAGQSYDLNSKNQWIKDDTNPADEQRDLNITADNVIEAVNNDESFVDLSKAKVSYRSSDPAVATVSPSGVVKAISDGVTTISVTVNGVTGSTPMVVKNTLTLDAPSVVNAGDSITATTTYTNATNTTKRDVNVALDVPSGWQATATSPADFAAVAPGAMATTSWQVTAAANATTNSYTLAASARVGTASYDADASVAVPYASLSAAYDNAGVSDDADPAAANFDGGGLSLSAQALAGVGITPGGTFTHDGVTFTWPDVGPGGEDNVVASGQTFAFSGSGGTLGILGASNNGTNGGAGEIIYTDGTTQSFALSLADWWAGAAAPGSDIAATLPYINNAGGKQDQTVHLYCATVTLAAGKTIRDIQLPDASPGLKAGSGALHVFAIATG
jgi:beta-glucosidase-like glycosyl hydrolase